jgi:hypothetical protein
MFGQADAIPGGILADSIAVYGYFHPI